MENNLRKITKEVGDLAKIRDPVESLLWIKNHLKKEVEGIKLEALSRNNENSILLATIGEENRNNQPILLSGHTDIYYDRSRRAERKYPPFSGKVLETDNDLVVYGCGSSDMKEGFVSIMEVLSNLSNSDNLATSVSAVFTMFVEAKIIAKMLK